MHFALYTCQMHLRSGHTLSHCQLPVAILNFQRLWHRSCTCKAPQDRPRLSLPYVVPRCGVDYTKLDSLSLSCMNITKKKNDIQMAEWLLPNMHCQHCHDFGQLPLHTTHLSHTYGGWQGVAAETFGGCVLHSEWHRVQKRIRWIRNIQKLYLLLKCEIIWEHSERMCLWDHLGFHFTSPAASIVAIYFPNLCHFWRMDVSLRPLAPRSRSLDDSKWNCHKRACQLVLPSAFSLPSRSLAATKTLAVIERAEVPKWYLAFSTSIEPTCQNASKCIKHKLSNSHPCDSSD